MFDYFTELMLSEYFTILAMFGRFMGDSKKLFNSLKNIFLLSDNEAERLFRLTEDEEIKGITSERDYQQYRRIKQFVELCECQQKSDGEIDELINIKGSAITVAKAFGILQDAAISKIAACRLLTTTADCGLVVAMNILGILQSEGIIFKKDREAGLKNISKAAGWNSEEGLMAALYYVEEQRPDLLNRMRRSLEKSSHSEEFGALEKAYGKCSAKPCKTHRLLEKAFDQGILKRELYLKQYARILFSGVLSHRDKESLFFSTGKDVFADAADLPLKLTPPKPVEYDRDALTAIRPSHKKETEKLILGLDNSDLRGVAAYRPLCIAADSRFILENYAEAVAGSFTSAHVEQIEVADLVEYDLEPTKNNIFVRSCDEDAVNVYLLFFRGDIPERIFDIVKNFLQTEKRAKFRLNHPGVCLDLAPILPICFCDKENAKHLRQYCDVIAITAPTRQEKLELTDGILSSKCKMYGAEDILMEDSARRKLAQYSVDEIERVIDTVIRDNRRHGEEFSLTEKVLLPYLNDQGLAHTGYGFGGIDHEGN